MGAQIPLSQPQGTSRTGLEVSLICHYSLSPLLATAKTQGRPMTTGRATHITNLPWAEG